MEGLSRWIWITQLLIVLQLITRVSSLSLSLKFSCARHWHAGAHMHTQTHIYYWLECIKKNNVWQGSSIRQQNFMEILFITLGYWIVAHKRSSSIYSQSKSWFLIYNLFLETLVKFQRFRKVLFFWLFSLKGTSSSFLTHQRRSYKKKLMNFLTHITRILILQTSNRYIWIGI